VRARALFGAAALAYLGGDLATAESRCAEGVQCCRLLPDAQAVADLIEPITTPDLLLVGSASLSAPPRLLEALRFAPEEQRVRAFFLGWEGKDAWCRGDYSAAAAIHDQSLAIYRELGDRQGIAMLLWLRGSVALYRGDRAAVRRYWEESLALYREVEDEIGICRMRGDLGYLAYRQAEYERAESLLREALRLSRRSGSRDRIASTLWLLGAIAGCQSEYDRAEALLEESLAMRRSGPPSAVADTLSTLGAVVHARGDYARARALQREALDLRRKHTDPSMSPSPSLSWGWCRCPKEAMKKRSGCFRRAWSSAGKCTMTNVPPRPCAGWGSRPAGRESSRSLRRGCGSAWPWSMGGRSTG
jgi:tetratricopeptide (TPR) repeat protein